MRSERCAVCSHVKPRHWLAGGCKLTGCGCQRYEPPTVARAAAPIPALDEDHGLVHDSRECPECDHWLAMQQRIPAIDGLRAFFDAPPDIQRDVLAMRPDLRARLESVARHAARPVEKEQSEECGYFDAVESRPCRLPKGHYPEIPHD